MRLSTALPFFNAPVLVYLLPVVSALTLSTFQQINGFGTACTNAYNTPLTDCSSSDFAGQGCSAKCIGFLDSLTNSLIDACSGTSVYPNTLIGLFFHNEGVQTLCSNAGGNPSSSDVGDGSGQSGGQDGAYSTGIQSAVGEASPSITSTSTSTTSSTPQAAATSLTTTKSTSSTLQAAATSSTATKSTSSTLQAAATSLTTTIVPTTVISEPTTTSVAVVETTVTPEPPSDASTSTSHTQSSTSSSSTSTSTSNGNGGGTPLDIGSSACHHAGMSEWLFALLTGSAGLIWFL
ncbi:MAG: hypothetical protein Q9161_006874 [Pseudevernia consocians]